MAEENNNNLNNFSNLSDKVWDIASSLKTSDFNAKLGESHNLSPKQVHILAFIEWSVFTKKISIQRFSKAVKEKLGLDKQTAQEITEKVNKNLFAPVKEYLKKEEIKKLEPKEIKKPKEKEEKKQDIYKQMISPYEKEREVPMAKPIKINHKIKEKTDLRPIPLLVKKPIDYKKEAQEYKIRTMQKDIEKAKKSPFSVKFKPIPPRPPKKDNIIDLSGK